MARAARMQALAGLRLSIETPVHRGSRELVMSLVAGIVSLRGKPSRDANLSRALVMGLSRRGDPVETFEDDRLFLAKVDFGAFQDPVFIRGDLVTTVSGEPFYEPRSGKLHRRAEDLAALAPRLAAGDLDALLACAGTFSFVVYEPARGLVLIGTDRLGIRPVYVVEVGDALIFATSVRILEGVPGVPRRMDTRAVTEMVSFGIPLGDRTLFTDVKNLRGGHVVAIEGSRIEHRRYFRWANVPRTALDREAFLEEAHRTFVAAVEARSARDRAAVSYLSGGLDSRVVVASLRLLGKETHSLTFEYPNLQDGVIARRFAAAIGSRHTGIPVDHAANGRLLQATSPGRMQRPEPAPRYPMAVFSGDGGSVGLGFVYMSAAIVDAMRSRRVDEAIACYLASKSLPRRIMTKAAYEKLRDIPALGVREELDAAGPGEPAKVFHAFLMDNDQRRHLHYLYEDLDLYRVEMLLPFLDGRWLDLIASAPVDWFLRHAFYYDFLKLFPAPVSTIPWQSYPGHLPCPIPQEGPTRPQWELTRKERFEASRDVFNRCRRALLTEGRFPSRLLRRRPLLAAALLHELRVRNYAYFWSAYDTFQSAYRRSEEIVF